MSRQNTFKNDFSQKLRSAIRREWDKHFRRPPVWSSQFTDVIAIDSKGVPRKHTRTLVTRSKR